MIAAALGVRTKSTPEQREFDRAQREQEKKRRDDERARRHEEAAREAAARRDIWED